MVGWPTRISIRDWIGNPRLASIEVNLRRSQIRLATRSGGTGGDRGGEKTASQGTLRDKLDSHLKRGAHASRAVANATSSDVMLNLERHKSLRYLQFFVQLHLLRRMHCRAAAACRLWFAATCRPRRLRAIATHLEVFALRTWALCRVVTRRRRGFDQRLLGKCLQRCLREAYGVTTLPAAGWKSPERAGQLPFSRLYGSLCQHADRHGHDETEDRTENDSFHVDFLDD